jgi:thiosulfate/3-mercaptopyruvate sulfurtransferase
VLNWNFLTDIIDTKSLILDCRSEAQYESSTLKNAVGAAFIKKPYGSGPQSTGKLWAYLKDIQKLAKDRNSVLVFDEGQGMYASRMAWLLMSLGIETKILAQRFSDIGQEHLGAGAGQLNPEEASSPVKEIPGIVNINYVQQNLTRVQLLDVRTPDEYEGILPRMINPEIGSICGRIPGSMNWDWRLLYNTEGVLRPRQEIVGYIRQIGIMQERPTVIYDFNGARSCGTALILNRCGYKHIHVYNGSWMEWRKSKLPKQNMRTYTG